MGLPGREVLLEGARLERPPGRRGTGCRLASALAVGLGQGLDVVAAARRAKTYVTRYLRTGAD